MKKKLKQALYMILCISILAPFLAFPPQKAEAALAPIALTNPGFEDGSSGWDIYVNAPSGDDCGAYVTNERSRSGSSSLVMYRAASNPDNMSWGDLPCADQLNIPVEGGKTYTFSIWAWTEMTGGDGPMIAFSGDVGWLSTNSVLANGDSGGWKQISFTITTPDEARSINARVLFFGTGTVWLDDATLTCVEPNIVFFTSFEELVGEQNPPASLNTWANTIPADPTADRQWSNPANTATTTYRGSVFGTARTGNTSVRIDQTITGTQQYNNYYYRINNGSTAVIAGQTITASVWIKGVGVGANGYGDSGAYIAISCYGSNGTMIANFNSAATPAGDSDWALYTISGTAPYSATPSSSTSYIRVQLCVKGTVTAYFDDLTVSTMGEADGQYYGSEVTLSLGSVINDDFLGFGAHNDYYLNCAYNSNMTAEDRELYREKVEMVRPQIIRFFFAYQWWTPGDGTYYTNLATAPVELQDLVEWATFLKDIGTDVLLCPWGDYFGYPEPWREQINANTWKKLPRAEYREAMVDALVALLGYLVNDLGLDNVKYVTLINEPDNGGAAGQNPSARELDTYSMQLTDRIRTAGLQDRIKNIGVDTSSLSGTGTPSGANPGIDSTATSARQFLLANMSANADLSQLSWADGIAYHTYLHGPSTLGNLTAALNYVKSQSRGKPVWIAEFGAGLSGRMPNEVNMPGTTDANGTFQMPLIHRFDIGLWLGDFTIAALKGGASALLDWWMGDEYCDSGGNKQETGLWKDAEHGMVNRPVYYSWSLINRYTEPNSRVVGVDIAEANAGTCIDSVALIAPDGRITIFARNKTYRPITLNISDLQRSASFDVYVYDAYAVPKNERSADIIDCSATFAATPGEAGTVTIPPQSFAVMTEITYLDNVPRAPKPEIGNREPVFMDDGIVASFAGYNGTVLLAGDIIPEISFNAFKYVELDLYVSNTELLPGAGLALQLMDGSDVMVSIPLNDLNRRWNKLKFTMDSAITGEAGQWAIVGGAADADLRLYAANFVLSKDPDAPMISIGIRELVASLGQATVFDINGNGAPIVMGGVFDAQNMLAGEFVEFDLYVSDAALFTNQAGLAFSLLDAEGAASKQYTMHTFGLAGPEQLNLKTGWNHLRYKLYTNGDGSVYTGGDMSAIAQWSLTGGVGMDGLTLILGNLVLTKNPVIDPPDIREQIGDAYLLKAFGPSGTTLCDYFKDIATLDIWHMLGETVDFTQSGYKYIEFDLYVSDALKFNSSGMQFYLRRASTGGAVNDRAFFMPSPMQEGWNHVKFTYSAGTAGPNANVEIIDLVCYYMGNAKTDLVLGLANFCMTDDSHALEIIPIVSENLVYDAKPQKGYSGAVAVDMSNGAPVEGLVYDILYESDDDGDYCDTSPPINAGSYTVTLTVSRGQGFYGSGNTGFTIAPKAITIRAEDKQISLFDPLPAWTYTVDIIEGDELLAEPVMDCPTADVSAQGRYAIEIAGGTADSNYVIAGYESGTLTVCFIVSGVVIDLEVIDGVAVVKPTAEQMREIIAACESEILFSLRGFSAVDIIVDADVFKDVDKTIMVETKDGASSVSTKSLWNNSGKQRLISVRENKLTFGNI